MKKRNMFMMMTAAAASLFMFGAGTANASLDLRNPRLVCNPKAIEAGQRSDCYIVGEFVNNTNDVDKLHGYVIQAFTTKDLSIIKAENNPFVQDTTWAYTDASSGNSDQGTVQLNIEGLDEASKTFKCAYDPNAAGDQGGKRNSYGCAVFYGTKSAQKAYSPKSIADASTSFTNVGVPAGAGVLGKLTVELSNTAKNADCGEVCVKIFNIPEATQYSKYNECAADPTQQGCEGGLGAVGDKYFCNEVHMNVTKPDEGTPETGAFVSYAIIIGGALIAISAVAIAKKNNKFNRI